MKLLMISSAFQPAWDFGGPIRSTWNLARGLAALGVEVTVLTTNASQQGVVEVARRRTEEGVEIWTSSVLGNGRSRRANRFGLAPGLWRDIARHVGRNDLVHVTGFFGHGAVIASIFTTIHQRPLYFSPRGELDPWPLRQKRLKKSLFIHTCGKLIASCARAIHFTSLAEMSQAPSWLMQDKGFVVPNAVEFGARGDAERFRLLLGVASDTLVLGVFGRLHRKKGFDTLIPALARCARRDLLLVVAGADEDGYRAEVERMVRQAGLAPRVRFLGLLKGQDLADAFAGIDALLLPSHHENFGNVVVEATAHGTPVIISDKVALRDWVLEKDAGIVLPLEPEAWTRAIEGLDKTEVSSRWESKRLMKLTRESFSIESVARRMFEYYQSAINLSAGK